MNKNLAIATAAALFAAAVPAAAQTAVTYTEVAPAAQDPLIFGVASHKLCEIKTFLFSAVYILGAIAFVLFAVKALFTKFEIKSFVPILGALFVVASADLFIAFMSPNAYYCPTVFTSMGG